MTSDGSPIKSFETIIDIHYIFIIVVLKYMAIYVIRLWF